MMNLFKKWWPSKRKPVPRVLPYFPGEPVLYTIKISRGNSIIHVSTGPELHAHIVDEKRRLQFGCVCPEEAGFTELCRMVERFIERHEKKYNKQKTTEINNEP